MVMNNTGYDKYFYRKLHSAAGFAFPQDCPKCRKNFKNVEEFISKTKSVEGVDRIFESHDPQQRKIIEIVRQCSCGKVILEEFYTRRDDSLEGIERRAEFSHYLDELCDAGMVCSVARTELLSVMRGKPSPLMKRFGIEITSMDLRVG